MAHSVGVSNHMGDSYARSSLNCYQVKPPLQSLTEQYQATDQIHSNVNTLVQRHEWSKPQQDHHHPPSVQPHHSQCPCRGGCNPVFARHSSHPTGRKDEPILRPQSQNGELSRGLSNRCYLEGNASYKPSQRRIAQNQCLPSGAHQVPQNSRVPQRYHHSGKYHERYPCHHEERSVGRNRHCKTHRQQQPLSQNAHVSFQQSEKEIRSLKLKVKHLKDELKKEKHNRSLLEEKLSVRICLAESENISKEKEWKCKVETFIVKLQQLKQDLKEKKEEMSKTTASADELAASLVQIAEQKGLLLKLEREKSCSLEEKLLVAKEKMAKLEKLSQSYVDEKLRLLEMVATQKKLFQSQEGYLVHENQELKDKLSKLLEEKIHFKVTVKSIKRALASLMYGEENDESLIEKNRIPNDEAEKLSNMLVKSQEIVSELVKKLDDRHIGERAYDKTETSAEGCEVLRFEFT